MAKTPGKPTGGIAITIAHAIPNVRGLGPQAQQDDQEPDADDQGGPPDQDEDDEYQDTATKPEWVHYTTAQERCHSCPYMGQDGMCAVLKMPVSPMDSCDAHPLLSQKKSGGGAGTQQAPQGALAQAPQVPLQ